MNETQIVALPRVWQQMRADPKFVELMRLARVANSLALAYPPILLPHSEQTPSARRARFTGLVYSTALLKEGLHTSRSLGKWFRERTQYREGIGAILSDPAVQTFESELADKVRDELVFHFDRGAMATGLDRLPDGETIIASFPESGPTFGETYFELADLAVFTYLFGDAANEDYIQRIEAFMVANNDLFVRFLAGSHRLITIGLLDYGCVKRNVEV
jgi:hypothetical protein